MSHDRRTLVLFDIDGTLLDTIGAGIEAVRLAGCELVGPHFDERRVEYAGRLDPVIFRSVLEAHEAPAHQEAVDTFRARYAHHLPGAIDGTARAISGAVELLGLLEQDDSVTNGLLTGNFPETGMIKLRACGIDPERFSICVWSTCGAKPVRSALPPVGMARWSELLGGAVPEDPRRTVIVGDTPEDVACAHANGCRCVGVATGHYSTDELRDAGADLAVETLDETDTIARWITS